MSEVLPQDGSKSIRGVHRIFSKNRADRLRNGVEDERSIKVVTPLRLGSRRCSEETGDLRSDKTNSARRFSSLLGSKKASRTTFCIKCTRKLPVKRPASCGGSLGSLLGMTTCGWAHLLTGWPQELLLIYGNNPYHNVVSHVSYTTIARAVDQRYCVGASTALGGLVGGTHTGADARNTLSYPKIGEDTLRGPPNKRVF
jgi:hypothetical protein